MMGKKKPVALRDATGQPQHQTTTTDAGAIVSQQADGGKLASKLSPRQARAIEAMMPGHWITRETMDRVTGASNAPDVIWKLRRKIGADAIDMELIDGTDRDGRPCRTGRYRLTEPGRARLAQIKASTGSASTEGRAAA